MIKSKLTEWEVGLRPTSPPGLKALRVTPRLRRALELARAEARPLGHRCVGTEHVLLGIARLDEGVAVKLLRELGAPPARIREEIATRLGIAPPTRASTAPPHATLEAFVAAGRGFRAACSPGLERFRRGSPAQHDARMRVRTTPAAPIAAYQVGRQRVDEPHESPA
jgi:hypothetical protein